MGVRKNTPKQGKKEKIDTRRGQSYWWKRKKNGDSSWHKGPKQKLRSQEPYVDVTTPLVFPEEVKRIIYDLGTGRALTVFHRTVAAGRLPSMIDEGACERRDVRLLNKRIAYGKASAFFYLGERLQDFEVAGILLGGSKKLVSTGQFFSPRMRGNLIDLLGLGDASNIPTVAPELSQLLGNATLHRPMPGPTELPPGYLTAYGYGRA